MLVCKTQTDEVALRKDNFNSAMTQTFCPKTLAGFAMSNFAELVCRPSPHLLLISPRQGKRSRKCQKPSNKSHCLQRKRGVCFCTNNNTASSLWAVIIFPCKSFAGFLHFAFLLRKHLSWKWLNLNYSWSCGPCNFVFFPLRDHHFEFKRERGGWRMEGCFA